MWALCQTPHCRVCVLVCPLCLSNWGGPQNQSCSTASDQEAPGGQDPRPLEAKVGHPLSDQRLLGGGVYTKSLLQRGWAGIRWVSLSPPWLPQFLHLA